MIQELQANYDTIYSTSSGTNNIAIKIQPQTVTPNVLQQANTLQAVLLLTEGEEIVNNNSLLEGELIMILKNTLKDVDWEIDDEGNLIVHAPDADNYSIDSNGFLIYTYR